MEKIAMKVYMFDTGDLYSIEDTGYGYRVECNEYVSWFVKFNFELLLEYSVCLGDL